MSLDELEIIERRAPLEMRGAEVVDVRHPDRTIEIIAAPYEQETPVLRKGAWITETIDRAAFEGVDKRARRVKVNRDHDVGKTVGRATALHPDRPEGLVAELLISRTPTGDETLELAADGVLDASIGFAPMRDGEVWTEQRSRRRITRAWLGHIALVPDPAYEGANVLDVRSLNPTERDIVDAVVANATPNKDRVLAQLRELGYPQQRKQ